MPTSVADVSTLCCLEVSYHLTQSKYLMDLFIFLFSALFLFCHSFCIGEATEHLGAKLNWIEHLGVHGFTLFGPNRPELTL